MSADGPSQPGGTAAPAFPGFGARLSLFYGTYFLLLGVLAPFWPLFLSGRGLDAGQIGLLLGTTLWARMVAGPLTALVVDGTGNPRLVVTLSALATLGLAFALFGVTGFGPTFALSFSYYFMLSGMLPLVEAITLRGAAAFRGYGRIRLWGSITFVSAAFVAGLALEAYGSLSPETILWLVVIATAFVALSAPLLPNLNPPRQKLRSEPFRRLLASPPFLLMMLSAGLIQGGHAVQFGFGSLRWAEAGYPSWLIGLLWAEASAAEILLFAYGGRLVERLGPSRLLGIAGGLGALRWLVLGVTTELWAVVPAQLLHAANFGAMHLGAMLFIARAVGPGYANVGQSLYSGLTFGAMTGGAMLLAGWLYALSPFGAYAAAAALSAGGAAAALALGFAWRGAVIGAPAR